MIASIKKQPFLWVLMIFFILSFIPWTITRHNHFQTDAVDLGIFDQVIWKYSQFKAPLSSIKFNTFPGVNILGDHTHFILVTLAPLMWIFHDVRALLVAQVLLVVAGVWPLYQLSMRKTNSTLFSWLLSLNYLIFIGLQTLLEYDFHEIAFALPLMTFGLYFLELKKYRRYFICFILTLLVKEDMSLVMAMFGIWTVIQLKEYKVGLITFFISALTYWLITSMVVPYFKHAPFDYEHLDPAIGVTTADLIKKTVTNPLLVVHTAIYDAQWIKAHTMLNLILSYAFVPLLSPASLIMLIPNIISRFMTDLPQRWIIRFQYSAIWDPILAIGTIYAMENLLKLSSLLKVNQKLKQYILIAIGLVMVGSSLYVTRKINGPLVERIYNPSFYKDSEQYKKNYSLLAQIPPNASVMAQSVFVPHLSHRDAIYRYDDSLFTRGIYPDYILMSLDEHTDPPYLKEDLEKRVQELKNNPHYQVLSWDGTRLLEKRID